MDSGTLVLIGWAFMTVMMSVLWLVQRAKGDAGVVDVGWTAGLGILAVFYAVFAGGDPAQRLLVAVLVGIWSTRLALHADLIRIRGKEEGRDKALRDGSASAGAAVVFEVQGLAPPSCCFPSSSWRGTMPAGAWSCIAVAVRAVAVVGEASSTGSSPPSRRPVDQGDRLRDGAVALLAASERFLRGAALVDVRHRGDRRARRWMTLISPATISFFLLRVTGILVTERQALRSRGDAYRGTSARRARSCPGFGAPSTHRGTGRPRGSKV